MLLPLLTSLVLGVHSAPIVSTGAIQVPDQSSSVPAAIATTDVPASLELTATHFLAQSRVQESQWIVFKNAELGLLRVRGLRPFESALLPVPTGGSKGMSIELIARSSTGAFVSTGLFRCEDIEGSPVFFERTRTTLFGWIPRHGGRSLTRLATGPSTVALSLNAAAAARPHVPVPLPSENRGRSKGRRVSSKKLPPI